MLKAFKYRMYPKNSQIEILAKHFGCVRFIYNYALEQKIKIFETKNKSISCFEIKKQLVTLKSKDETKWLKEVNSQSLQEAVIHLDKAFTRFFREKKGFPKFKKKCNRQSFSCPQNVKVDFHNKTIELPKIGKIKTIFSRQFEGKVKTCTISKTPTNKYYVSILIEDGKENKPKHKIKPGTSVGVDLGIKDFAILSNGTKIANPKYLRSSEKRLKCLQRRASKKVKGSENRRKANLKVAKVHENITNQRTDFLHKVSTKLVRENQTICLETLNVVGMLKNHCLAKSISDASWSKLNELLKYKADWYGCNLLYLGRFEASSKTCNVCGTIKKDLTLKDRTWKCQSCGSEHDRDINAAINIRKFGLQKQNLINTGMDSPGELLELPPLGGAVKEESTAIYCQ